MELDNWQKQTHLGHKPVLEMGRGKAKQMVRVNVERVIPVWLQHALEGCEAS